MCTCTCTCRCVRVQCVVRYYGEKTFKGRTARIQDDSPLDQMEGGREGGREREGREGGREGGRLADLGLLCDARDGRPMTLQLAGHTLHRAKLVHVQQTWTHTKANAQKFVNYTYTSC